MGASTPSVQDTGAPTSVANDANMSETASNLWSKILSSVGTSRHSKLAPGKSLIVVGDKECGKTTLISKLQGKEEEVNGCCLEYCYINVRDDYRDDWDTYASWMNRIRDQSRLSVWTLSGQPGTADPYLLDFALDATQFNDHSLVVCASLAEPWALIDRLTYWLQLVEKHIADHVDADVLAAAQTRHRIKWKRYTEPARSDEQFSNAVTAASIKPVNVSPRSDAADSPSVANNETATTTMPDDAEDSLPPLPDGVLTHNLGLDVTIVITKTDCTAELERQCEFQEHHFDFVQASLRRLCLAYGAALIYTSVRDDSNCDLLYRYLVHRIYALPFASTAHVIDKAAVFVPAGWDTGKKVAILDDGAGPLSSVTCAFNDVIPYPTPHRRSDARESRVRPIEVMADDDQAFLRRMHQMQQQLHQQQMQQQQQQQHQQGVPQGLSRKVSGQSGASLPPSQQHQSLMLPATSHKKESGKGSLSSLGGGPTTELANFFNSLLTKKTSGTAASVAPPPSVAATVQQPIADTSTSAASADSGEVGESGKNSHSDC